MASRATHLATKDVDVTDRRPEMLIQIMMSSHLNASIFSISIVSLKFWAVILTANSTRYYWTTYLWDWLLWIRKHSYIRPLCVSVSTAPFRHSEQSNHLISIELNCMSRCASCHSSSQRRWPHGIYIRVVYPSEWIWHGYLENRFSGSCRQVLPTLFFTCLGTDVYQVDDQSSRTSAFENSLLTDKIGNLISAGTRPSSFRVQTILF